MRSKSRLKRVLDLVVSIMVLILVSPVLCMMALIIRFKLGAPVIFRQVRPGLRGEPFKMYKFRTMNDKQDEEGKLLPDAERLTRLGNFLRSASLDELPEFINVVKGDMSLVGPRPLLMQYLDRYTPEQARRHEVKPGITGWAQVNGRNALSWEGKFALDVWYVDNQSFWLDLRILGMTIWKVFRREGISSEGCATMDEFMGSELRDKNIKSFYEGTQDKQRAVNELGEAFAQAAISHND